jgi:hypothetical protein
MDDTILPLGASEHCETRAERHAATAERYIGRFEQALAKETERIDQLLNAAGAAGKKLQRSEMIAAVRRELYEKLDSDPEFKAWRLEAAGDAERIERAAGYYGDDLRIAELMTADGGALDARVKYATIVRGAGYAQLLTLAQKARSEKNLPLAIALAQEVGPIPRKDRPFDLGALVRDCISEKDRAHQRRFRNAQAAMDKVAGLSFKVTPTTRPAPGAALRKIRLGLRARERDK